MIRRNHESAKAPFGYPASTWATLGGPCCTEARLPGQAANGPWSEAMEHMFAWPKLYQGAVSLTYDDGLPIHWSLVDPLLRRHHIRATYYPTIQSDLRVHPAEWRELAAAGHELGNHTVFHPCRQSAANPHTWLDARYDLAQYTAAHLRAELEIA